MYLGSSAAEGPVVVTDATGAGSVVVISWPAPNQPRARAAPGRSAGQDAGTFAAAYSSAIAAVCFRLLISMILARLKPGRRFYNRWLENYSRYTRIRTLPGRGSDGGVARSILHLKDRVGL